MPRALIFFLLSTWFQYLSVQIVGIVSSPFKVDKYRQAYGVTEYSQAYRIVEYYSFFEFQRGDFIERDKCYDSMVDMNSGRYFLECKTDSEISLLEKLIFKKYRLSKHESLYVLDGIGPFFTLSISDNTMEH